MSLSSTTSRGYLGAGAFSEDRHRLWECHLRITTNRRKLLCRWSVQRDHSKLQKPPHVPPPVSGAAAAATNTQWQERTADDVPRACSSARPRRLARAPP